MFRGDKLLCFMIGLCATSGYQLQQPNNMRPNHHHHPSSSSESMTPALSVIHKWKYIEYDYDTPQARQNDINDKTFIPGNAAPIDVDVYYSEDGNTDKIFLAIPRFQEGIPATLGTVTDKEFNGNPVIKPYPSWSWHTNPEQCKEHRIVHVFRVFLDECGRLWVLDSGSRTNGNNCPAQLLAFDPKTDRLIHKYEIPSDQVETRSVLVTPVVDIRAGRDKCENTFIYMADCQTYSIIVYDLKRQTSWKITDKTMYPYPNYGSFDILGDKFDLMDGLLGLSLTPYKPQQDRKLFYHALASASESWVYTSYIRNQTRFDGNPNSSPEIFHTFRWQRPSQSAAEAIDKNGIMFFGLHSEVTLNCWNTATEYNMNNIDVVANDREKLQFLSGIKVITNRMGEQELWLVSSRFQKIMTGSLSTRETNFRILAGKVDDVLISSKCKVRTGGRPFLTQ